MTRYLLCCWSLLLAAPSSPEFRNTAAASGLVHTFPNGGSEHKQFIIETTGSGAAFFDYDRDGRIDIFLVSGEGGTNRLYHNEGRGQFRDVTASIGLTSQGWGQGVCAGDYDNDGYTDLFVTYWGQNHLFRNRGGTRFEDVTAATHLQQDRTRYNSGCAFLDYDNDGRLDLFVANYLQFDPATTPKPGANPYCYYRGMPVNCGPRGLPFDRNILYHSNHDGTFTDVSKPSGIAEPFGHYSLGVLTGDFNGDGRPDLYVACDQTPSLLYINQGDGTFAEEAVLRGVAFDADGKALSGMGVAAGDYDGDGQLDIFRTNFSDERATLYRNRGGGDYDDTTLAAGLGRNTRFVGWGCSFFDYNNDGWPDLLLANGHVFPEVDKLGIDIKYRDRAILYQNTGKGFTDVSMQAGPAVLERHSARGLAIGDVENNGRLSVLINNQNEPPALWQQHAPNGNHWLLVQLEGTRSNRSALGARVRLTAGGHTQTQEVRSGGSYLSQSDLRLHFGLGSATEASIIEIRWPSGTVQTLTNVRTNRVLAVREQAAVQP